MPALGDGLVHVGRFTRESVAQRVPLDPEVVGQLALARLPLAALDELHHADAPAAGPAPAHHAEGGRALALPGAGVHQEDRRCPCHGWMVRGRWTGGPVAEPKLAGGLMVCGTASDAGKSTLVTALCRALARRGVRVAPFKAQNMALNSFVTADGSEIGRAQGVQALAAGVEPQVAMNPILLKPTGERASQVIVQGRPIGVMTALEYHAAKPDLVPMVLAALADLRSRFDVVLCEGAGSPAEINLLDHDLANLRIAADAGLRAVVVGDIDRGGVFASLYGTVALLPESYRRLVGAFVINKFRGDPALLFDATDDLERRCGVPTLGVLPMLPTDVIAFDAEDSLALDGPRPSAGVPRADPLDVAVVRLPYISNVTDVDALAVEPGVSVRLVRTAGELGRPDLVVLPGTKATVADLAWLRAGGWPAAIEASGADVLGICGGYQMLGEKI